MGKFIVIISWILIFLCAFLFIILGAGSHGHMGLWDHKDSFFIYSIIYWCFFIIASLSYIYFRHNAEMGGLRIFVVAFNLILLIVGIWLLYLTLYEHSTIHHNDRVGLWNYIALLFPLSILLIIFIKLISAKAKIVAK
jgi:hypothetical protein